MSFLFFGLEELQKQVLEKEEAAAAEATHSALEPDDDAADFDAAIEETVLAKAERQLPPVEDAPDLEGSFGLNLPKLAHHIRQRYHTLSHNAPSTIVSKTLICDWDFEIRESNSFYSIFVSFASYSLGLGAKQLRESED